MKHITGYLSLLSFMSLVSLSAQAAHIEETMTLAKGWNAIYLESTPTNAACADFFAGAPVERVASYQSDAYSSTRQIADDGTEIAQKPVSYRVWVPGDAAASTMTALRGGCVYLIYAKDVWTTTFLGVPAAPRQTWRATSGETGFMNLVGVSADTNASVTAKAYFGEGPFGTASGVAYKIAGTKTAAPTFLSLGLASSPKVKGGQAYAFSATKDGDWPGVVGVQGDGVVFGTEANYASITVRNCGTKDHEFRFTMGNSELESDGPMPNGLSRRLPRVDAVSAAEWTNVEESVSWTVSLGPDETTEQVFKLDRSKIEPGKEHGAILTIEDLGSSAMRVRLPLVVLPAKAGTIPYPAGLWIGEIALTQVTWIDDTNSIPVKAGGTLKMSVMMHVDTNGTCRLLQRVAAGMDTNGTARLFKELANVPAEIEAPKRFSTVMMSVDTPSVAAADGSKFGDSAGFSWTIDAKARDNPFRHAWHPDHDGKTADYSGELPSGDDLANYVNPVKPELWSVTNTLCLSWHKLNNPTEDADFEHNPEETTAGYATWTVGGLLSNGQIKSMGVFFLKRIADVGDIE